MSRTGDQAWKMLRRQALALAIEQGQTCCPLCNTWLDYEHHGKGNSPEVDHIIAHADGGHDGLDNVRVICRSCNRRLGGQVGNRRMKRNQTHTDFKPKQLATRVKW